MKEMSKKSEQSQNCCRCNKGVAQPERGQSAPEGDRSPMKHDNTTIENAEAAETVSVMPGVYDALARLPERALVDEGAMARAFGVNGRTIRRMVNRHELPPPLKRAGRALWFAGRVLDWLEEEADLLAKDADKLRKKIQSYSV